MATRAKPSRVILALTILLLEGCGAIRQRAAPSFLDVSKVIVIDKEEDPLRIQCPITSANSSGDARAISIINVIWILHKAHVVIGGGTKEVVNLYKNYDHNKYVYIRGTGDLQINNASSADTGVYRCIAELGVVWRNGTGAAPQYFYETAAVELVTGEGLANRPRQIFTGNLTRAIFTAAGTLLFLTVSCVVYSYRWKDPKFDKVDVEDGALCNIETGEDQDRGESYRNWEETFEESEKDAVEYNACDAVDDVPNIFEPHTSSSVSRSNNDLRIYTISSDQHHPQVCETFNRLSSTGCGGDGSEEAVAATLQPPPETSPTFSSSTFLMRRKVEEAKQDGISFFTAPHASSTTTTTTTSTTTSSSSCVGRPVPLFQFESTTCSTLTGGADTCQRKVTKQQWWWNWTASNISPNTSTPTSKDSIAVETMQKLVAVPPITSPSSSEYSTVSTVSSSLAKKSSTTTLNIPLQLQSNL